MVGCSGASRVSVWFCRVLKGFILLFCILFWLRVSVVMLQGPVFISSIM